MIDMGFRYLRHSAVAVFVLGLAAVLPVLAQDPIHRGRKYKAPPPTSRVDVTIVRKENGKPIENAAVVFQLVGDKGNMELKTNEDGKTMIDVLPTGSKVLVQVIAKGFQTYGGEYTLDKTQMTIEVKLRRPGQQYSIYEEHPQEANSDQAPQSEKNSNAKKDTSKDQPSESAKESDSKPDASQPQPQ
jgi:Carboxypeptidase regulatory-like domain